MAQWFYRGSLRSCNYHCSYCPFSKSKGDSGLKLENDERGLIRFVDKILEFEGENSGVMITPYGEALVHPYYIREMARLSRGRWVEQVGCQSNFSFNPRRLVQMYRDFGGDIGKLRLWGTFHPEMVSVKEFADKCFKLKFESSANFQIPLDAGRHASYAARNEGVKFCVGAVGVPENIYFIRELKSMLPEGVYLWINRMDGMKRPYSQEEISEFLKIDPYFSVELSENLCDKEACRDSFFVEADGEMRHCALSGESIGNLYKAEIPENKKNPCKRKRCSCYIAYSSQKKPELFCMGKYPMFRIPEF